MIQVYLPKTLLSCPPILPDTTLLTIANNPIVELPELRHTKLNSIFCDLTLLTELPELPDTIRFVDVSFTFLTKLPDLKQMLRLDLQSTFISDLPPLPTTLRALNCDDTPFSKRFPMPDGESYLEYAERMKSMQRIRARNQKIGLALTELFWHPDRIARLVDKYGLDEFEDHVGNEFRFQF